MKKTLLIFLLTTAAMFLSCGEDSSTGDENSIISGTVMDKSTKGPVSGVKITIAEQEATSDANGQYQLTNIPPDTYNLRAKTENYASYDEEVSLNGGENNIDIELETFVAYCARVTSVSYQGRIYNTVAIGNQCWFKENLNVGTRIDGDKMSTNNPTVEKYCYKNFVTNCDTYGGLYQWEEAMMYISAHSNQGICPDGWHIPTYQELEILKIDFGENGNALKEIGEGDGDGAGTNTSGFSALLGGYLISEGDDDAFFENLTNWTHIWTSTESGSDDAFIGDLNRSTTNFNLDQRNKNWGVSIRCIKD
jgi:uncharacterized protein (TIGR02145 family)